MTILIIIFRLTDQNTQIQYFPLRFLTLVEQFSMTQPVYLRNFKKGYRFSIIHHFELFPKCIAHYWWLTHKRRFTVNNSDFYGFQYQENIYIYIYDSKSLKIFRKWSFSDNFTIETDNEARISFKKDKICSKHFKWVSFFSCIREESGIFYPIFDSAHTFNTSIDLLLTFCVNNNYTHWRSLILKYV